MNTFAAAIVDSLTLTTTENGAVTNSTSLDPVVDMFFAIGAKRGASYEEICSVVIPAFEADEELAMRVALWARDIRQGAGERRTYRHILRFLAERGSYSLVERMIEATFDLGRADDVLHLLYVDQCKPAVSRALHKQLLNGNSLVAKWLPRKGIYAKILREMWGMTARQYRKNLVHLTNVVETQMCERKWDEINYSHVPSVAMSKYSKAFSRRDGERFEQFLNNVKEGKADPETGKVAKINTGAVYPYDITRMEDEETANIMWQKLPDFVPEGLSFLPIIDTSSSMNTRTSDNLSCMDVSVSLGIYLAERNKGAFKDLWINFSTAPNFNKLKGETISEKISNLDYSNWQGSTNLEAAMKLILNTAVNNNVRSEDMPNFLLVLSDMEFNEWGNDAPGKNIKLMFEDAGYKMPNIVWWNIQSRNGVVPVRANEDGMALVSGFSPTIVSNLLSGEVTPVKIMMNTIMKDRYNY